MKKNKPSITFILSSLNRSGGSRVTVLMANLLIESGYKVRIVCNKVNITPKYIFKKVLYTLSGKEHKSWGHLFEGDIVTFHDINELSFQSKEIVFGVGTDSVSKLRKIKKDVIKVRYCHGFAADRPELTEKVWSGSMNTITVSHTLVPTLEKYSGEKVLGVVPNGISKEDYYKIDVPQDGIGLLLSYHYNKSPEDAIDILKRIENKWPDIPIYVYGESMRPRTFSKKVKYYQLPTLRKMCEIYNRCKIWLVVSRMEGLPGPVLEAMACGSIVISTDNLGSMEIINNNVNGFIQMIGDLDGFMKSIEKILNDQELQNRIRKAAFDTVDHFNWQKSLEEMEKVIQKLL